MCSRAPPSPQFCINLLGLCAWGTWSALYPLRACHGDWLAWGLTVVANVTFLHLFVQMYRHTYRRQGTDKDTGKDTKDD